MSPLETTIGVLKAETLAQLLGCTVSTVESKARNGELPGLKFGDEGWVFPVEATVALLNEKALADAKKRREPEKLGVLKSRKLPALPSL